MDIDEVVNQIRFIKRCEYFILYNNGVGSRFDSVKECDLAYNMLVAECPATVQRAEQLIANYHHRKANLNKRAKLILEFENPCFLTLTFSDHWLQQLNVETRRKYVARYLKEHYGIYVANVDFGSMNGRFHYHAIAGAPFFYEVGDNLQWYCGRLSVRLITFNLDSPKSMADYINTMVNHSFKDTAKGYSLVYSRGDLSKLPRRVDKVQGDFSYLFEPVEDNPKLDVDKQMVLDYFEHSEIE